jgi:hypothetical protein
VAPKCSKYAAKDSRSKMLHMPSKLGILVPKCRKIARKTATDRKMEIAPEFFGSRKLTVVDSVKKSHATIFVFEVSLHRHKTKIDSLDVVSVGFLLYPCVWILAHIPLQKV